MSGGAAFWLLTTLVRPRLRPEPWVSRVIEPTGARYRVKVVNRSLRGATDVLIRVDLIVPGLAERLPKNRANIRLRGESTPPLLPGRLYFSGYVNVAPLSSVPLVHGLKQALRTLSRLEYGSSNRVVTLGAARTIRAEWPERFRELVSTGPLPLDQILEEFPGSAIRVTVAATDRLSGTRSVQSWMFGEDSVSGRLFRSPAPKRLARVGR